MKTLVVFYSYTGKTKVIAENRAKEEKADILELKEKKPRSKFNAYFSGSIAARKQRLSELQDFSADFSKYDKIIIAMPIWAGYPAPAINNIIYILPYGKEIELIMTSGSGSSKGSCNKTKALIEAKGCKVINYTDIKG